MICDDRTLTDNAVRFRRKSVYRKTEEKPHSHADEQNHDKQNGILQDEALQGNKEVVLQKNRTASSRWLLLLVFCAIFIPLMSVYVYNSRTSAMQSAYVEKMPVEQMFDLWETISRPFPIYQIAYERQNLPIPLIDTRKSESGTEEDRYSFNEIGRDPYFFISLYHAQKEQDENSFYISMVLKTAEYGIAVNHASQPESLDTKLGIVELAAASLEKDKKQECILFRHNSVDRKWGFQGWFCNNEGEQKQNHAAVTCLINSLELTDDPEYEQIRSYIPDYSTSGQQSCI